jgi:preprotein translocase subunit SecF
MRIFKTTPQVDFMKVKKPVVILSVILLLASGGGLLFKGLTYGIDFRGGTLIQVKFEQEPQLETIRDLFQRNLTGSVNITTFGDKDDHELIITLSEEAVTDRYDNLSGLVDEILGQHFSEFEIRREEMVGARVGDTLKNKAIQAAFFVLIGILIYIGFRFRLQYAVAAVVALFHDVLITLGIFVFLEKEFTLTIVAAILTIIGYSLNDTIVVFDRVRENIARFPRRSLDELINLSVNECLSRTLLTSLTTFLVVFTLWVLGGDIIHDFCFALLIGLIVGTYSSVFIASPVVIYLSGDNAQQNLLHRAYAQIEARVKNLTASRR